MKQPGRAEGEPLVVAVAVAVAVAIYIGMPRIIRRTGKKRGEIAKRVSESDQEDKNITSSLYGSWRHRL